MRHHNTIRILSPCSDTRVGDRCHLYYLMPCTLRQILPHSSDIVKNDITLLRRVNLNTTISRSMSHISRSRSHILSCLAPRSSSSILDAQSGRTTDYDDSTLNDVFQTTSTPLLDRLVHGKDSLLFLYCPHCESCQPEVEPSRCDP
jgi:hypothetical protein